MDLSRALIECEQITVLFFTNHLNEALEKTKAQLDIHFLLFLLFFSRLISRENRSFYHSISHSVIRFMQATTTFQQVRITHR